MPLPRYSVHDYSRDEDKIEDGLNMIGLAVKGYVITLETGDLVEALRVGDEQLSDKGNYYIRRIS